MSKKLPEILKNARLKKKLSQVELGKLSSISQAKISKLENGESGAALEYAEYFRLTEVLGLKPVAVWKATRD